MIKLGWKVLGVGIVLLAIVGCVWLLRPPAPVTNVHLTLGNPSNATASNPDNYLLEKPQYALSYNNSQRIPNWASWQLNASWLGNVPRRNDFRPDAALPQPWVRVTAADYNGSGFDRGHMTPSADRTNNPENNSATFLMTNILPQAPDNNQGPWADLENYCRDLVKQGKELYIVSGGYGKKRTLRTGIGIPTNLWKVIVVLERPGLGLPGVNASTRTIAVNLPNAQGLREQDWRTFRVAIDAIESATGYNFLSNLPESVQAVLESRVDR